MHHLVARVWKNGENEERKEGERRDGRGSTDEEKEVNSAEPKRIRYATQRRGRRKGRIDEETRSTFCL